MPHSSVKPNIMASNRFHLSLCDRIRKQNLSAIRVHSSSNTRKRQRHYKLKYKSKGFLRRQQPDWSKVHRNLLESIHQKLSLIDILQCRAVCSPWRPVAQAQISSSINSPHTSSLPPLIIWKRPRYQISHWFLDVTTSGEALYQLNESESIFDEMGCCIGFSHGWFIFFDRKIKNKNLCLFHPSSFPQAVVRFPRISTTERYRHRGLRKVVLWAEPILSNGNYGVVVMHKKKFFTTLLFAKAGATQFSELEYDQPNTMWDDIICLKNIIYGVARSDNGHHLVAWDCNCVDRPKKLLDFQPKFNNLGDVPKGWTTFHLVESQGDLLLVTILRPDPRRMERLRRKLGVDSLALYDYARSPNVCRVYKMDFKEKEWVQMNSLEDQVLFIMENQNVSVSCHEFPQYKGNTVYFRHYIDIPCCSEVIGVFNFKDGSMGEIQSTKLPMDTRLWGMET